MAIPFQLPPSDESARLQQQLEHLLVEMFEVLAQLVPQQTTPPGNLPPASPTIAPVGAPQLSAPLSPTPMQNLVSGIKSSTQTTTAAAGAHADAAIQRQSWQQLGVELRLLADQFSNKQKQSRPLTLCSNSTNNVSHRRRGMSKMEHPLRVSDLARRLLCLLAPKTLGYSAAVLLVGLRLLKSRFA